MKETKVDLFDSFGKFVFNAEEGYINQSLRSIILNTNGSRSCNVLEVFIKKNYNYIQIANQIDFIRNFDWKKKYYVRNNSYEFLRRRGQNSNEYEEFNVLSISINLVYYASLRLSNRNNNYGSNNKLITIQDQDELDRLFEKKYSLIDDEKLLNNCSPYVYDVKIGDYYWLDDVGEVTVIKKYDYPTQDKKTIKLFSVVKTNSAYDESLYQDEKIFDITILNINDLKFLPFDDIPKCKYSFLNDSLNEIDLMPYLTFNNNLYNLYWKKIEGASNYVVAIYLKVQNFQRTEYYHLANYDVDRNTAFFSIDTLIVRNGEFVFKLYAENRTGEKIAESRGIVNGQPQFFEEVH